MPTATNRRPAPQATPLPAAGALPPAFLSAHTREPAAKPAAEAVSDVRGKTGDRREIARAAARAAKAAAAAPLVAPEPPAVASEPAPVAPDAVDPPKPARGRPRNPVDHGFPRYRIMRVADLVPYAGNPRTHGPANVAKLVASIQEFGFTVPVMTDGKRGIVAGHGRVLAAQKLGMETVPVVELAHLTKAQRRAYVIADNRLTLDSGWDEALLLAELGELRADGFDLSLTGFDGRELAALFGDGGEGLTDPDAVPDAPADAASRTGDVWLLGPHRLVCGDCTTPKAVNAALAGAKPHLMVTDPPYGVEYDATWRGKAGLNPMGANRTGKVEQDDRSDWREAWALFPGNIAYVWHGGLHAPAVAESLVVNGFALRAQIIWNKSVMAMSRGDYHWQHEPCWYAVRKSPSGKAWHGDRSQSTLWQIKEREDAGHGHATQKPVECMRRPIENNTKAGDGVYDPFVGSGTTIIAAEMTSRVCHAIEIAPAYVDVALLRWQAFTGQAATLDGDGRSFAEIAAARAADTAAEPVTPRKRRAAVAA